MLLPLRRDGGLACGGGSVVVTLDLLPPRIKVRAATRGLCLGCDVRSEIAGDGDVGQWTTTTVDTRTEEAVGGKVEGV